MHAQRIQFIVPSGNCRLLRTVLKCVLAYKRTCVPVKTKMRTDGGVPNLRTECLKHVLKFCVPTRCY